MRIHLLTVGPFAENAYLVRSDSGPEGYIVDPGDEFPRIARAVGELGMRPLAIVNTHAHLDHVGAVAECKRTWGIPFRLHRADEHLLANLAAQCAAFGLPPIEEPEVDDYLAEGEELPLGEETIQVIHTPGHSPGSVTLHCGANLLVGDVLFAGSVGRVDLPGGSWPVLAASIRDRLLVFPDTHEVYPGHGPSTTIGAERRTNPFLEGL